MNDQRRIPRSPLLLGIAGLIPFWALSLGLLLKVPAFVSTQQMATALAAYGAIILSFLGGIRWGLAMTTAGTSTDYFFAVVPSVIGWALVLAPDPWRLAALGIALLGLGPADLRLIYAGTAPFWFGRLRIILSSGAGSAMIFAAMHPV